MHLDIAGQTDLGKCILVGNGVIHLSITMDQPYASIHIRDPATEATRAYTWPPIARSTTRWLLYMILLLPPQWMYQTCNNGLLRWSGNSQHRSRRWRGCARVQSICAVWP